MIGKYAEIFCWKNVSSFCSSTHIFSAKYIRILYIESVKTVNEMTLNGLVKLTMLWTTGPWLQAGPLQPPDHQEIDHRMFSTVILSLLLIQEGHLSVSGERMCTILVNRLEDLACPVNVWLGKLSTLDMTPRGWLAIKPQHKQTNLTLCLSVFCSFVFQRSEACEISLSAANFTIPNVDVCDLLQLNIT